MQILVFSERHPGDLDASLKEAPPEGKDTPDIAHAWAWKVFIDWFLHLLDHHYFWEAQRILHSLFHVIPWSICEILVQHYLDTAVSMTNGQEAVKIAVSSLVQRFMYVSESGNSNPLAVVQWNNDVTWALFGITLGEANEQSTSLVDRIFLSQSLQKKLSLRTSLPLYGADRKDILNDLIFNNIVYMHEYAQTKMLPIIAEPLGYTEDRLRHAANELSSWALSQAAQGNSDKIFLFLNSRTVNARDGYQRTPLHWASLNGQSEAVELLLSEGSADVGLVDWFGYTSLHYAVEYCRHGRETQYVKIIEALLKSNSDMIDMRYPDGKTMLGIAILRQAYDVAELLLGCGVTVEESDYEVLPLDVESGSVWQRLQLQYDHQQSNPESFGTPSGAASGTANLGSPAKSSLD